MAEFAQLHTSLQEASHEVLTCPRCSNVVTDRHGICRYCRENAFQCRQCRGINYEVPDAFMCQECGYRWVLGSLCGHCACIMGPACDCACGGTGKGSPSTVECQMHVWCQECAYKPAYTDLHKLA